VKISQNREIVILDITFYTNRVDLIT